MKKRRKIDWEVADWAAFFQAGGTLTVDAWERATSRSRGFALATWQALHGAPVVPAEPAAPAPADPAKAARIEALRATADAMIERAQANGGPS